MNFTIYNITLEKLKIINVETLQNFLSNIENLNDRDIRFISSNTRLSYFAIRDEIIVLKMDFIKSIITKEHIFIIKDNVNTDSIPAFRNYNQITIDNINQINQTIKNKKKSSTVLKVTGLESILYLIEQYFSKSVQHLVPEVNKILSDIYYPKSIHSGLNFSRNINPNISSDTNTVKFKNFLKIQKEIIDLEFRVKEVYNIIEELEEDVEKLDDDEDSRSGKIKFDDLEKIKNGNFIQQQINNIHTNDEIDELEEILGTYNIFICQILSEIQKYGKEMETTKEYFSMLMAQRRNDIAYMNIYSSVINLSISCCMLIASFFGMNLSSTLESSVSAFIVVIILSLLIGFIIILSFHNYIKKFKN
jgi:hypothetical protein